MNIFLTIILDLLFYTIPFAIWQHKNKISLDFGGAFLITAVVGNLIFLLIGIFMGAIGFSISLPVCVVFAAFNIWLLKKK